MIGGMAGYRPVGCPASVREPLRVRNGSALVRSGNRLAYSRSNWSMRSVWLRSAWREPWEERLLTGRVQVAQLALQCLIVQLMRIEAELPRHSRPFHPPHGRPCHQPTAPMVGQQPAEPSSQGS